MINLLSKVCQALAVLGVKTSRLARAGYKLGNSYMIAALGAPVSVPAAQTTETTLWSVTLPPMVGTDRLDFSLSFNGTGSAGNKTFKVLLDGVLLIPNVQTNPSVCINGWISCQASSSSKLYGNAGITGVTGFTSELSIDTSTPKVLTVTCTVANTADTCKMTSGTLFITEGV